MFGFSEAAAQTSDSLVELSSERMFDFLDALSRIHMKYASILDHGRENPGYIDRVIQATMFTTFKLQLKVPQHLIDISAGGIKLTEVLPNIDPLSHHLWNRHFRVSRTLGVEKVSEVPRSISSKGKRPAFRSKFMFVIEPF